MTDATTPTVLVLGAGINGCALARELVLNRINVDLVDTRDAAAGTTAHSSRLIHGGLRYLEYGEFDLVRESLAERTRLLRLAPQFVRPLRLFIPLENRCGGLLATAAHFFHREPPVRQSRSRGLWLVRAGLWFYDQYARDPSLPRRATYRAGQAGLPRVDGRFGWLCAYYDAQIRYPERFVLALIDDARRAAEEAGVRFRVFLKHEARLEGRPAVIAPCQPGPGGCECRPGLIVNATGAWVDETLAQLRVPSPLLIGGTKGSHLLVDQPRLREALAGEAIYAEARDGRPVFILPFGATTLVGTTDQRYSGPPGEAQASPEEIQYLLETVNSIVPEARLEPDDVELHYSGVRPLPAVAKGREGTITRRHWLEENRAGPVPLFSLVGGKLTTCRSLAQSAMPKLLARLERKVVADSQNRVLPGGESYPASDEDLAVRQRALATRHGLTVRQVASVWDLCGTAAETILDAAGNRDRGVLSGTELPRTFVRWQIETELSGSLIDLVERRLMLVFQPRLPRAALEELAAMLVEAGQLDSGRANTEVDHAVTYLHERFGKRVVAGGA